MRRRITSKNPPNLNHSTGLEGGWKKGKMRKIFCLFCGGTTIIYVNGLIVYLIHVCMLNLDQDCEDLLFQNVECMLRNLRISAIYLTSYGCQDILRTVSGKNFGFMFLLFQDTHGAWLRRKTQILPDWESMCGNRGCTNKHENSVFT